MFRDGSTTQDGNYRKMAKQFQENAKMKVFSDDNNVYNELFSWVE